ncbi:MAG TPA: GGDEF domain-containing protein [Pseudolabrys sp.]|nr:GGDEF domain-containing protein [Pseudolabrys sp.]
MHLDVKTLFMVTIHVEAILGLLLLFAWVQNTQIHAVAWWGFAHLVRAASVTLFGLYGYAPNLVSIDLANALLFTAFAMTWTGARVFDGRPFEPVYLITGAVIWFLVCRLPVLQNAVAARALIASGIVTTYTWLTAYEFWRGRDEKLVSRWPAIFMLFAHGALYLLRTPLVALLPWAPNNDLTGSVWLTVLSFEALLLTISIAFILLAMAKERTELRHLTAAMVDALTGIANRRSFLQEAQALAQRHGSDPRPTAVLLIDLDHFKSVNDRFGHAIGDRTLQLFAEAARASMRSSDLLGRLGGEEFAAVLRDADEARALAVADRVREAFARAAQDVDGRPVCATVSIGVVLCGGPVLDVTELLAQADQALYFAKERGRNRVELASLELARKSLTRSSPPDSAPSAVAAQSAA